MRLPIAFAALLTLATTLGANAEATMRVDLGDFAPMKSISERFKECTVWDAVTLEPAGVVEVPRSQDCEVEPVRELVLAAAASVRGVTGHVASYTIEPAGGRGSYTYGLVGQPDGFSLSGNVLSANFGTAGSRAADVLVSDHSTPPQSRTIRVTASINLPVAINANPLASYNVQQGKSVLTSFRATGGAATFSYGMENPPAGVTVDPASGRVQIAASVPVGFFDRRLTVTDPVIGTVLFTNSVRFNIETPVASGARVTFGNGSAVTFTNMTAKPAGNITYSIRFNELHLMLNIPCGYVEVSTSGTTYYPSSWNGGGPTACSNLGMTPDELWTSYTGQPARGAIAGKIVASGTSTSASWTVVE